MFRFGKTSDVQIIQRVLGGRHDEFEVLLHRYLPAIQAISHAQLGNATDAEDIAQDTFVKAWQSLGDLQDPGKFTAWLFTIARNACNDFKRKHARRAEREKQAQREAVSQPLANEHDEMRKALRFQVDKLDETAREVLLLHYYAGKKVKEIAQMLEVSPEAVKKRLQRAREALSKSMLNELAPGDTRKRNLDKQSKAIMGIIGAMPPAWQGAGTVSAGVVTGGGGALAMKLIGAAVALALVGTGVVLLADRGSKNEEPLQISETVPQESQALVPARPVKDANASVFVPEDGTDVHRPVGALICTVLDPEGKPVANAEVQLNGWTDSCGAESSAEAPEEVEASGTTGAGGVITFSDLRAGSYDIRVGAESAICFVKGIPVLGPHRGELTLRLVAVGRVSGEVVNIAGEAVPGVEVQAGGNQRDQFDYADSYWQRSDLHSRARATTDEAGKFVIDEVPLHTCKLRVKAEGYAHLERDAVAVNEQSVRLTLQRGGAISGIVLEAETRKPLSGIKVQNSNQEAVSDEDGAFALSNLRPGKTGIKVQSKAFIHMNDKELYHVRDEEAIAGVELLVARSGSLSGRAYDAATGKDVKDFTAVLELQDPDTTGRWQFVDSLRDRGIHGARFSYEGLRPGTYRVTCDNAEAYQRAFLPSSEAVEIKLGQKASGVDLVFGRSDAKRAVNLRGIVYDEKGLPASSVSVSLYVMSVPPVSFGLQTGCRTDADGRFEFTNIPPGPYNLLARHGDFISDHLKGSHDGSMSDHEDLALHLRQGAIVSGRVVSANGTPVTNLSVHLDLADDKCRAVAEANKAGEFRLAPLLPGKYEVMVIHKGSLDTNCEPRHITIPARTTYNNVVITMPSIGALTISGRVTNSGGEGVAGAYAHAVQSEERDRALSPSHWPRPSGRADTDGFFTISGLFEGDYEVSARHQDYYEAHPQVVSAGESGVTLVLANHASVRGQVVNGKSGVPLRHFEITSADRREAHSFSRGFKLFDEEGRYELERVLDTNQDGEVYITARAPGMVPGQVLVRVAAGEVKEDVIIRLEPGKLVEGRVVNGAGEAVAGALVFSEKLYSTARREWIEIEMAAVTTDEDGRFALDTVGSEATALYVWHEDYLVAEALIGDFDAGSYPIVMPSGGALEGVVRSKGRPLPDLSLCVFHREAITSGWEIQKTRTDENGRYRVEKLTPGEVQVELTFRDVAQQGSANKLPSRAERLNIKTVVEEGQVSTLDIEKPDKGGVTNIESDPTGSPTSVFG